MLVPPPGRLDALDYRVPPELGAAAPGARVLVPLGGRRSMGIVVARVDAPVRDQLRDVISVLDPEPVLDPALLRLLEWMAEYYLAAFGDALATALPGVLRIETERMVEAVDGVDSARRTEAARALLARLRTDGPQSVEALRRRLGAGAARTVAQLQRHGAVRVVEQLRREAVPTRRVRLYEAAERVEDSDPRFARRPALLALYRYLRDHPLRHADARELRGSFPDALAKLRALTAAALVRSREEEQYRTVLPPAVQPDRPVALTAAQRAAVEAIGEAMTGGFAPFLLFGVTGSGKTEVYLHAVTTALAQGRTALILVPEISLTHQLVDRVRARFGEQVAVLHSQLSDAERWDEWRRLSRGEAAIAIGARSAVFAPLQRLGVVIVDEEHDAAYKQGDGVRYHGRDVAVMRAKLGGCALVLGSATPAMESFQNATDGRYRLLELPERVASRPLPAVDIVDLRGADAPATTPLSPVLAAALEANLAAGGQSLLFLNRRGFANFLQCRACGDPLMCPNCSVTLTWHRHWRALRCHYCDHTVPRPARCATCGEPALAEWGVGTEQVEAMLRGAFPGARIGRMDRDTTRRKGSQLSILEAWVAKRLDILVGTQMIAKGHDVPGVTLVGVLLADLSLAFPDFRAAERTFQLIAQVAGRAGRGAQPGRVIVQTLQPEHYSLRAARAHDFRAFARHEMAARRELGYPPLSRLLLLRIEGEDVAAVERLGAEAAAGLRALAGGRFVVLGPAPAPLERLRQRHRRQILLRGRSGAAMRAAAAQVLARLHAPARARRAVDGRRRSLRHAVKRARPA